MSQFGLDIIQVLNSYIWLLAAISNSVGLEPQEQYILFPLSGEYLLCMLEFKILWYIFFVLSSWTLRTTNYNEENRCPPNIHGIFKKGDYEFY